MSLCSKWDTPLIRQVWTSCGVLFSIFGQGMVLGYPSCLLPALQAVDSPIKTDIDAASWIASVTGISNMIGCFSSTFFMDLYGRRTAYIVHLIPDAVGWTLIYFATNIPMLIAGRVLCGFTGGAISILGAIIIGEFTDPKIRGVLLNFKATSSHTGVLIVHLIGDYLHWRTVSIIASIPQFVALFIIWTWPESPAWLASKKKFERSAQNYFWLRGEGDDAKKEFEEFIQAQREKNAIPQSKLNIIGKAIIIFKKFARKDFSKPIIILTFGGLLFEACGKHIFPMYAKNLIGGLTTTGNQAFYYVLIIDVIVTTTTSFSSILVKTINRRTLLFSTGLPALILLLSVSLYLFLVSNNTVSNIPWVSFSGFAAFITLSNMGCTLMPFILLGEILPLAHRSVGLALFSIIISIFTLLAVKTTPYLLVTIHVHGTLAVLALFISVSLLFLFFMQPETKDRTLQQIEDYFTYGKFRDSTRNDNEASIKIITE